MPILPHSKKSILLLTAREKAYFYDYIILRKLRFCNIFGSVKVYFFWNFRTQNRVCNILKKYTNSGIEEACV